MTESIRANSESETLIESERIAEGIHKLERSEVLMDQGKVQVLLAYAGIKPVSSFGWFTRKETFENLDSAYKKDKEDVESILADLNLTFYSKIDHTPDGYVHVDYMVSKDQSTLQKMAELQQISDAMHEDDYTHMREFALAFGYPETAMLAFTNNTWTKDLPEDVASTELGRFYLKVMPFRLSKEHWKKELLVVEEWANKIKELSPTLYNQIINS